MKSVESHTVKSAPHLHGWQQDDSALIPRERSLLIAWWIAIILAMVFIIGATVLKPDPYWEIVQFIGDGLVVTFQITIVSMTLALILGLIAGLGRTATNPAFNTLASLYVEVIRGIPLLAQLFWIYYAMSRFIRLGPEVSAVLGLTICYGAYIGETFRGGIQSIPKGQMEAARALGLTRGQAMRYVIIPQAVRVILPPVGNEFIAMLKDSSLVSVLAISDMLRRGREYASRTFAYFETYTLVALVYLLVTLIFSRVVFYIEQGMSRQNKEQPVTLMHRLAGGVVDLVVLDFIGLIVYGLIQAIGAVIPLASPYLVLLVVMVLLGAVYVLFFWTRAGRTPGMMAVGLRLTDGEGAHPTLSQAFRRLLFLILPLPGLSLLWMLWSSTGEPLHDRFARTHIIRD
ncbi:MAG TPA: ABC transporter permease subunit [Anaerolineae bacterium]|nr:ABC transporter permease subunit [Anaerolineae bacterium]HQI86668.1 ABC transporter permease subunit [Anaerolineae bacterium]HQK13442.1 ABC transporter permease subunit [Anaerolineae bacterium]